MKFIMPRQLGVETGNGFRITIFDSHRAVKFNSDRRVKALTRVLQWPETFQFKHVNPQTRHCHSTWNPEARNMLKFMSFGVSACVICGCANLGLGEDLLSTPLSVQRVNTGFNATQRAGVDRPANDPTWETIRRQKLAETVTREGICPQGIEAVSRTSRIVRTIEIGSSQELTYSGRCK
ncbi:MAG: hypothetical protein ACKVQK_00905 [Burkholderiales bacterium]